MGVQNIDYYADNGVDGTIIEIHYPLAVYEENITFTVWNGDDNTPDPYIRSYDHNEELWSAPVKIADGPLTDDSHGVPAVIVTPDNYVHAFFGAHLSPLKHSRSNDTLDISGWTAQADITTALGNGVTYPQLHIIGTTIHLLYRVDIFASNKNTWAWRYSTDNASTWSAEQTIIDFGNDKSIYALASARNDTSIQIAWTYYDQITLTRNDTYHAFLNVTSATMTCLPNTGLGASIDKTEADASCMVKDSGVYETNMPHVRIDGNANPYIIYPMQDGAGWHLNFSYWTGSAWAGDETIVDSDHQFMYGDLIVWNSSYIEAYLNTAGHDGWGGDIDRYTWDGSTWTYQDTILSESASGKPLGNPQVVENFTVEFRLIFAQGDPGDFTDATLRAYAWGSDGFVQDVTVGESGQFEDQSANTNTGTIIGEDSFISVPDSTVTAGAWTPVGAATLHEATDELNPNGDTDYANISTNSNTMELGLGNIQDPLNHSNHVVRVNARSYGGTHALAVELREGATLRASDSFSISQLVYVTKTFTLTTGEASAIVDYNDLRLRFSVTGMGGGDYLRLTYANIRVPDEPTQQVVGEYSLAWDFDGQNDYVSALDDTSIDRPARWTFHVWMTLDSDGNDQVLWNKYGTEGLLIQVNTTGDVMVSFGDAQNVTLTVGYPRDVLAALTVVYNNITLSGYLNGTLADSATETGQGPTNNTAALLIGQYQSGNWVNGTIDELMFFSNDLSAAQVAGLGQDYPVNITVTGITPPTPGTADVGDFLPTLMGFAIFAIAGFMVVFYIVGVVRGVKE